MVVTHYVPCWFFSCTLSYLLHLFYTLLDSCADCIALIFSPPAPLFATVLATVCLPCPFSGTVFSIGGIACTTPIGCVYLHAIIHIYTRITLIDLGSLRGSALDRKSNATFDVRLQAMMLYWHWLPDYWCRTEQIDNIMELDI